VNFNKIEKFMKKLGFLSLSITAILSSASCQNSTDKQLIAKETPNNKMIVEIWSDVMCPFCYIGKRQFELALSKFEHKNEVEVVWRSFELNPTVKTDTTLSVVQYLSTNKGIPLEEAQSMADYATNMAQGIDLEYHFEKAVVANSFKAHQFLHFAKEYGKQSEVEEALFKAYFTDGKNTDDTKVLLSLATEIGLDSKKLEKALANGTFSKDVKEDELKAQQLGINGVPFFYLNESIQLSGAQDAKEFLKALNKAYVAWKN
jgi:predicted DsbA family dithiol-disulfide isomerase